MFLTVIGAITNLQMMMMMMMTPTNTQLKTIPKTHTHTQTDITENNSKQPHTHKQTQLKTMPNNHKSTNRNNWKQHQTTTHAQYGDFHKCRLRPSTKFEVRRPSRSEDTVHLVCQLSIYNSFPVIRTTIAKIINFTYPGLHFLFALGKPLRQSRKTFHEWKDNSVLAKPLAACTH